VTDEWEAVRPHEGFAAGEDEHGGSEFGELGDEAEGLDAGEFLGMAAGLGLGAAVAAGEGTGAGELPEDEEGPMVEAVISRR
jgi:hypothetical protein